MKKWWLLYGGLSIAGIADTLYLTIAYLRHNPLECSIITGCDVVLGSSYAVIAGIPVAVLGLAYYLALFIGAVYMWFNEKKLVLNALTIFNSAGFFFTLWLIYLQAYVINAWCQYCLVSALITTLMFIVLMVIISRQSASHFGKTLANEKN